MTIEEIINHVADLDGVLAVRPGPGDGSPEVSWGDTFFYYAPDGVVPTTAQPFATIVVKNYPGDERSRLERPDTFRVNIAAGTQAFVDWIGHPPREPAVDGDPSVTDAVMAHPVYGSLGWLAVVNPGRRTGAATRELLRDAYRLARARHERRTGSTTG
ncbi:hypothetical protein F0344_32920 [Streptomyces finlayi]|uniref:DUF6194 domain-containing protein n=1 Tax=Streptomyces finlayi TaxID=67296 RepID=A0A7G7BTV4_9ACTN|nr:DUF6194 family protein [Streptomyces finlayi]QNE78769.1 hypothetical protein F0344_32920 [Streptomyces finlayi]